MLESGMASCESISPFRDSIDLAVIEPRSFPLIQIRTTLVQTMGEDKRSVTELTWKERHMTCYAKYKTSNREAPFIKIN